MSKAHPAAVSRYMEAMFLAAFSETCVLLSRGGVNTTLPCVFRGAGNPVLQTLVRRWGHKWARTSGYVDT